MHRFLPKAGAITLANALFIWYYIYLSRWACIWSVVGMSFSLALLVSWYPVTNFVKIFFDSRSHFIYILTFMFYWNQHSHSVGSLVSSMSSGIITDARHGGRHLQPRVDAREAKIPTLKGNCVVGTSYIPIWETERYSQPSLNTLLGTHKITHPMVVTKTVCRPRIIKGHQHNAQR